MLDARISRAIAVAAAILISMIATLVARRGRRAMAALGVLVTAMGLMTMAAGKIWQRWAGGPPLEGSLATLGSVVMVGYGGYIIWLAFFRSSGEHLHADETRQS